MVQDYTMDGPFTRELPYLNSNDSFKKVQTVDEINDGSFNNQRVKLINILNRYMK